MVNIDNATMKLIVKRCVDECIRQQVYLAGVADLLNAYDWVLNMSSSYEFIQKPNEQDICILAAFVNGQQNSDGLSSKPYRLTPVTFQNGGSSAHAENIPRLMQNLVQSFEYEPDIDVWVKEFLWIHPFQDGNGRTAFILYNWLKGTLEEPKPLPDYFGEI